MKRILLTISLPVLLITFWHVAVENAWVRETLVAPPISVAEQFVALTKSGELFGHVELSLVRLVSGFAIGTALGIFFGVVVGVYRITEHAVSPTIQALIPIPPPAWIPLLIIFLGIGNSTKIGLIAIGAFAVMYSHALDGIRSADEHLVEVAATYQRSRLLVLIPSALPNLFIGMRVALGLSWILLLPAEMISSRMVTPETRVEGIGLGWLIFDARRFSHPADMIVGMIAIGILGKFSDEGLKRVGNYFLRWRKAFKGV